MSIRDLDSLFQPQSVAVIGASERAHSVGATLMRNVLEGGFAGPIMPALKPGHAIGRPGDDLHRACDKNPPTRSSSWQWCALLAAAPCLVAAFLP